MTNPLVEFQSKVQDQWIDHNGHMNVAYYVLAFDEATDAAYEQWGIGLGYQDSGCSVFTIGMNVDYLAELFAGDDIRITTQLIDADHKRVHYFHTMYRQDSNVVAATNECLCMNVNFATRKSEPFAEDIAVRIREAHAAHKEIPVPPGVGRTLGIRR